MLDGSCFVYAKVPVFIVGGFEDEPHFDFGDRDFCRGRRHRPLGR